MQCQTKRLNVNGASLAIRHFEPKRARQSGAGRVAILVHGFAGNQDEGGLFPAIAARLTNSGCHAVTYDCRGLGESVGDYANSTLAQHVSDLRRVIGFVRARLAVAELPICGIGFSFGAAIIGKLLRGGPQLDAVVYLSPATRPAKSMWPRYANATLNEESGVFVKPENGVRVGRPMLDAIRHTDLGLGCFDIAQPLLICHGTDDQRIPIEHTRECLRVARGKLVQFEEFVGASHSFQPTQPARERLATVVSEWLAACPLGKRERMLDRVHERCESLFV